MSERWAGESNLTKASKTPEELVDLCRQVYESPLGAWQYLTPAQRVRVVQEIKEIDEVDPKLREAAMRTFKSAQDAVGWLTSPRISMNGRTPLQVARTKKGAKEVIALLKRIGSGYASPEEGLAALLSAEGGCVSVDEACRLYRKPNPVTRQTLTAAIRRGDIIGYPARDGHYRVPMWQFRPEGGLFEGLPEVLRAIREKVPGYDQLSPFTFFLQEDPVADGRTPLAALRDGDIKKILDAVDDHGH